LETSATDLSRGNKYSANQIATATRELVLIFQKDPVLAPLYQRAVVDPSIGPTRLRRNLRRLFKVYAEQLEDEATDGLEHLASRLVALKARYLAECIIEQLQGSTIEQTLVEPDIHDESSDEENPKAIDEDIFEDLLIFREFLVGSHAFRALQSRVKQFVLPEKFINSVAQAVAEEMKRTEAREMIGSLQLPWLLASMLKQPFTWLPSLRQYREKVWIASGRLEPPLAGGQQRLRWTCVSTKSEAYRTSYPQDRLIVRIRNVESLSSAMSPS
jgi:hypothetical protein